ncbi:uncharacterized protein WCC33_011266 [Rhinophrynus dorsalis]
MFETREFDFLGFLISPGCVPMNPRKILEVLEWPTPVDKKAVQRFLGFGNFYRRFIQNFSWLVAPLTALTKLNSSFAWSPKAQEAFNSLKKTFTQAPILHQPDTTAPFFLEVDSSNTTTGAVISQ